MLNTEEHCLLGFANEQLLNASSLGTEMLLITYY